MHRRDALLAIIGSANGLPFSPVQLQKAVFLIDRNLPQLFDEGSRFNFSPYDYGPFDRDVYAESGALEMAALVSSGRGSNGYKEYSVTDAGLVRADQLKAAMDDASRDYIERVVAWVRSLSFARLVKSIYEAYPEMRANSVFVG
jgi:hypothetical protein